MIVLINGGGNIGTTLAQVLSTYRSELRIITILLHKRTQTDWNSAEITILHDLGVEIVSSDKLVETLTNVDYIFEATSNGVGFKNKEFYEGLKIKGVSAQGSEKGFGIPYISGVNDEAIYGQKMVQIVSCNTHGTSAILQAFGGADLKNIKNADVVVVRRSEDIGNHERLVAGNVVARHLNPEIGTHHAIDVVDLYKTRGISISLTSSDITTPSQFLHGVRFNIEVKKELINPSVLIEKSRFLGVTKKFDSNVVFELGRRFGFAGRLYNHAIIVSSNLMINENVIKGWAFIPQEGNTILSTIHAFLLQTKQENHQKIMSKISNGLLINEV